MKEPTKKKATASEHGIMIWLTIQSIVIILVSIISFLFVEFIKSAIWGPGMTINDVYRIGGTILPLCAFLGALNYFLSRYAARHVTTLANGIQEVANGDFEVRLDGRLAGPFAEVYDNFNKMGDELRQVQILRDDFLNSYSHEFKTPITSIQGFANLLLETNVTEEERGRYLRIIADETARLAELANNTILLSKLDSQHIVPDKRLFSLDEQLKQCSIILASEWSGKNITFIGEMDEVRYYGNAHILQHLWLNLIHNAIKYTPANGEISVRLFEHGDSVTVTVSDTGCGMTPEVVARIFDRYYQADPCKTRHGLGLGLSIVKRIVDLCDGEIEVKSRVNEGSTFIVRLPNGGPFETNKPVRPSRNESSNVEYKRDSYRQA